VNPHLLKDGASSTFTTRDNWWMCIVVYLCYCSVACYLRGRMLAKWTNHMTNSDEYYFRSITGWFSRKRPQTIVYKNYVIQIMTWKFIYIYRQRCKTGPAHNKCWNWSPFTSKHTWMLFSKFWNTFTKVLTLMVWISWRIASLSCSIVCGVFLYTLPFNRPQRKKSVGVRSGDLGGQRFFEIILSLKKLSISRIWSVTCCTVLLAIPSS